MLDWARRIVGDYRAMRGEIQALKRGLAGHLRIAAVPTALPIVSALTTPLHAAHPEVLFTIFSRNSFEILTMLDNLEIEAGLTYVNNEPLGRARAVPLYHERYCLLIAADRPLGERTEVTWAEVAGVPLCLLTPDMQNRRIIDRRLREAGVETGADVAVELDGAAVFACADRPVGKRDASGAGGDDGTARAGAGDPDRRSGGTAAADDRLGVSAA